MAKSSIDMASDAWGRVLRKHPDIMQAIRERGYCEVKADTIKEEREPRLMTKHDFLDSVPSPLKSHHVNVLSVTRHSYVLGEFDVFQKFPEEKPSRLEFCTLPPFETLRVDDITTESKAINALIISGVLNRFLGTDELTETFNGRMGTGRFDFGIGLRRRDPLWLEVNGAQLEIDGGFENDECVVIMEAKNRLHDDFNVRQLYYPLKKYSTFVTKPIRLVFSQYDNLTYTLYEYEFADIDDFNSIQLVGAASYAFEDCRVTADDVMHVWETTKVIYDDNEHQIEGEPPFPQADKIERIFGLLEFLRDQPEQSATTVEIAEFMGTVVRQAAYYPAAGEYLGVLERSWNSITLSREGAALLKKNRRERLLEMVRLLFRHEIFHRLYGEAVHRYGDIPSTEVVADTMAELKVLDSEADSMYYRRAQTVRAWLKWLFDLPDED